MSRDGYQWAETTAARMLASALESAREQRGLSVRQAAKVLDYKQAVVLSHMATGRAPIPIDRAEDIARVLEMNPRKFLQAVLDQRHPEVNWGLITAVARPEEKSDLGAQLEVILGARLADLNADQRRVLREVAADRSPQRRWLSVHELPLIERIRTHLRGLAEGELSSEEIDAILAWLNESDAKRSDQSPGGHVD